MNINYNVSIFTFGKRSSRKCTFKTLTYFVNCREKNTNGIDVFISYTNINECHPNITDVSTYICFCALEPVKYLENKIKYFKIKPQ